MDYRSRWVRLINRSRTTQKNDFAISKWATMRRMLFYSKLPKYRCLVSQLLKISAWCYVEHKSISKSIATLSFLAKKPLAIWKPFRLYYRSTPNLTGYAKATNCKNLSSTEDLYFKVNHNQLALQDIKICSPREFKKNTKCAYSSNV